MKNRALAMSVLGFLAMMLLAACSHDGSDTSDANNRRVRRNCPPVKALDDPNSWELAPAAKYSAQQVPGGVNVRAKGSRPSAFDYRLVKGRTQEYPPILSLMRRPLPGANAATEEDYEVCVSIPASQAIGEITIKDRSKPEGRTIKVEQPKP